MQTHSMVRKVLATALPLMVVLLLAACGDGVPSGVLSQEEMVPVLRDLHIAYAGVDLTTPDAKLREGKYAELNHVVLDKYHLDEKVFYESYEYYQHNPTLMDTIYNEVINALNLELAPLGGEGKTGKPAPGTMTVNPSAAPGGAPNQP